MTASVFVDGVVVDGVVVDGVIVDGVVVRELSLSMSPFFTTIPM